MLPSRPPDDPGDVPYRFRAAASQLRADALDGLADQFDEIAEAITDGWIRPEEAAVAGDGLGAKCLSGSDWESKKATADWTPEVQLIERLEAKLIAYRATKAHPVEGDDLDPAAKRTMRLQERWEETLRRTFSRYAARRQRILVERARSVRFRRDTPLWDPPGDTPLIARLSVLVDIDAWRAELAAEIRPLLADLTAEAVESLDFGATKADEPNQPPPVPPPRPEGEDDHGDLDVPIDIDAPWLRHAVTFDEDLIDVIRQVLEAEPATVEDLTEAIEENLTRTAEVEGGRIATTIATGAVNESQLDAAVSSGVVGEKVWYSGRDTRVRPAHRAADGQRQPLDQPYLVPLADGTRVPMMFPGDITAPAALWRNCRCVTGETRVSGNVVAAMRRKAPNHMVEITTTAGHHLTATPEHPVLTTARWVPIGSLRPGDEVICRTSERWAPRAEHVGDGEPTIEKVYDALVLAAAYGEGVSLRSMHLDGQVPDQEVDVQMVDQRLPFGSHAALLEQLGQLGIAAAKSQVGMTSGTTTLDWIFEAQTIGVRAGAPRQPEVIQAPCNDGAADAQRRGHTEDRVAAGVAVGHRGMKTFAATRAGESDPLGPRTHRRTGTNQMVVDPSSAPAGQARHLGERLPFGIEVNKVLEVHIRQGGGHVYDLTTTEGAFLAAGIVVHNCTQLFVTPLSATIWDTSNGIIDPFGRATVPAKGIPLERFETKTL